MSLPTKKLGQLTLKNFVEWRIFSNFVALNEAEVRGISVQAYLNN